MKNIQLLFTLLFFGLNSHGQDLHLATDTMVVSQHSTTIRGQSVNYSATTGMQPLWDADGKAIATLYYTYYQRKNAGDKSKRPLLISFNGGPGSASVWMHVAYTGPYVLNISDEGYPVQPYGVHKNEHSILDVADIVYVNPVNTGYSRTIADENGKVDRDKFFGINADISYLADWLNTFMGRHDRWLSPKFLVGESYGGTRVMGLALRLQESQWMYINGVILVSPADYKYFNSDPAISNALNLPYYTAAAWHHKKLPTSLQSLDLDDVLPQSENYALDELMPAIARGGSLSMSEKNKIAERISFYTGLSENSILQNNLVVPTSFFWKELLRDDTGQTIGRLDSRYLGIDKVESGSRPDYSAELTSWLHSFTPAINYYTREVLNFKTDHKYYMFGPVHPWDRTGDNTREQFRKAMAENPYLNLLVQSGYYDGATTYFNAKYTMWQIDPSGKLKDRMWFKGYRSGHMMYLRKEDLKSANDDIRDFILKSLPDGPAKYE